MKKRSKGKTPERRAFLRDYRTAYRRDTLVNPIIIFVKDFEKCLRFYRNVFGLRLLHRVG